MDGITSVTRVVIKIAVSACAIRSHGTRPG
jgi:hypothetical protein